MTSPKVTATNIRDIRKSLNLSQSDVADYLGIKWAAYQRLESKGGFKFEQISTLAELFNVTTDFIINGSDPDTSIHIANEEMISRFNDITTIVQDSGIDGAEKQSVLNAIGNMSASERAALIKLINGDEDN